MMRFWKDLAIILPLTAAAVAAALLFSGEPVFRPVSDQAASDQAESDQAGGDTVSDLIETPPAETRYGIPVSSYQVSSGKIRWGQSLDQLLKPFGITDRQVYQMSLLHDSLLDERRIRQGNDYSVFSMNDTTPVYFVYEKDPVNYVVINLTSDPVWAANGQKRLKRKVQFVSGTIESTLWESMLDADANPMLAVELSEIFAWTIDFFGLQQGDRYKVIYEESYVDSLPAGINRILGAWIYHNNTEFWGIPFVQDGTRSFFDEEGNSLRKAFLKAPLRFSRISSGFSHSRFHPVLKIRRPHHGVDYAAPAGTPVHTVGDGVITRVGYQNNGGGNYVKIKHNSVYSTTYMHLSRFGKDIRRGRFVKQGDVIGYVGSTGLATGPHLDFRFYRNGSAVNPLTVEAPPVEPVHPENVPAYNLKKRLVMGALDLL